MENMRQITYEEFGQLVDDYSGKMVQVSIYPIRSLNTYQHFRCRDIGDNLEFYDINFDKPTMQEMIISKDNIKEILYTDGKNVYETEFSIVLENGEIELEISEEPVLCCKCGKLLDDYHEPFWKIDQTGDYGSRWDCERLHLEFCDNCLAEFVGYDDQGFLN
jgi:hypothetical protein